jgi:hypothetical protein
MRKGEEYRSVPPEEYETFISLVPLQAGVAVATRRVDSKSLSPPELSDFELDELVLVDSNMIQSEVCSLSVFCTPKHTAFFQKKLSVKFKIM